MTDNAPKNIETNNYNNASNALVDVLMAHYKASNGINAETIIGAAAAITGEFAMRAVTPDIPEKGYIFGDKINGILFEKTLDDSGELSIWGFIAEYVKIHAGATEADMPDWKGICERNAAAVGSDNFPSLTVPIENYPHEWSPLAGPRFRPVVNKIAQDFKLSQSEIAYVAGTAVATLIVLTKETLPLKTSLLLAAEIMKGVASMVPISTDEIGQYDVEKLENVKDLESLDGVESHDNVQGLEALDDVESFDNIKDIPDLPYDSEDKKIEHKAKFDKALLMRTSDLDGALELMRQLGNENYTPAINELGAIYYQGTRLTADYDKAHFYFNKSAALGDAEAMWWLAYLYEYGYGVKEELEKAVEWYQKSIDAGDVKAKNSLANLYLNNAQFSAKTDEAIKLLEVAVDEGSAESAILLSDIAMEAKNYKSGLGWLDKAVKIGDASACYIIGEHVENGLANKAPDLAKAIRWYELAAERGYDKAFDTLTELMEEGHNVKLKYTHKLKDMTDEAVEMFNSGKEAEAIELFKKGAEVDDDFSHEWLGYIYYEGLGADKNPTLAFKHYSKAAALGNLEAKKRVAEMKILGLGTTKDVAAGLKEMELLVEKSDSSSAAYYLGNAYYDGVVVKQNYELSYKYMKQANLLNPSRESYNFIGLMHSEGKGTPQDKQLAYSYYQQAALMGDEMARKNIELLEAEIFAKFDLGLVATDFNVAELLKQVNTNGVKRFSALITGPKGSGKKALAQHIAKTMDVQTISKNILEIAASSIDDTLRGIKEAFEEASTGKMLIIDGLEKLLIRDEVNTYFNSVESQKIIAKILHELQFFKYPFVLVLTQEKPTEIDFAKDFYFHIKLGHLNKDQKNKAYQTFFGRTAPKELSGITGLSIKDFDLTKRKLIAIGKLHDDEKAMEALREFGKGTVEVDENFSMDLVNSSENLNELTERLAASKNHEFSIILYGPPGTGKSRFLRHMARQLGYDVLEKKASDLGGKYYYDTEKNIADAFREAAHKKAFLIIDEVETLIGERKDEESFKVSSINELLVWLESHKYPVGCTTNNIDMVDRAALRRFLFKVKFNFLEKEQVRAAYKVFFGREAPAGIEEIGGLVPSDFSTTKKKAKVFNSLGSDEELMKILKAEAKAKSRSNVVHLSEKALDFDMKLINPSIDLAELEEKMMTPGARKDISLLIYGPPGTGKSQYLKHLAQKMGIEVISKRYSDMVSKWFGESEQKIADAFREAEDRKAFLIIDEIDSLLVSRANLEHQWQITQVNEMITWMESYPYPLAGTTNLIDNIDTAAMRRFLFNFKLDYLKPEQLEYAFQSLFGFAVPEALSKFKKFTPAILANAKKKAQIFNLLDNHEKVIKLIEEEIKIYGYKEAAVPEAIAVDAVSVKKLPRYEKPIYDHIAAVQAAVVMIKRSDGGHGSGFLISDKGYVLTNEHVIEGSDFNVVKLSTGRELPAEIIRLHKERDVALLKINGDVKLPSLPLRLEEINVASPVYSIGTPLDQDMFNTFSKGVVSGYRKHVIGESEIVDMQTDCNTHGGNSGGPIVDESGNVVGVHYAGRRSGQDGAGIGIGFCAPIADALKYLNIKLED